MNSVQLIINNKSIATLSMLKNNVDTFWKYEDNLTSSKHSRHFKKFYSNVAYSINTYIRHVSNRSYDELLVKVDVLQLCASLEREYAKLIKDLCPENEYKVLKLILSHLNGFRNRIMSQLDYYFERKLTTKVIGGYYGK